MIVSWGQRVVRACKKTFESTRRSRPRPSAPGRQAFGVVVDDALEGAVLPTLTLACGLAVGGATRTPADVAFAGPARPAAPLRLAGDGLAPTVLTADNGAAALGFVVGLAVDEAAFGPDLAGCVATPGFAVGLAPADPAPGLEGGGFEPGAAGFVLDLTDSDCVAGLAAGGAGGVAPPNRCASALAAFFP